MASVAICLLFCEFDQFICVVCVQWREIWTVPGTQAHRPRPASAVMSIRTLTGLAPGRKQVLAQCFMPRPVPVSKS